MSQRRASWAITLVFLALAAIHLQAQTPPAAPDATLYTTYSGTYAGLTWIVCGSTAESSGCYGSGSLSPFVTIGAMLEGNPSVNGDIVTRAIYIVDAGANPMVLYVYTKTDTVTASFDTVSVTLSDTITLPLVGGSGVSAFMAANNGFLFIGSDFIGTRENTPVRVRKGNLHVTKLNEFQGGTLAITADQYGYVSVEQPDAFTVYGPNGEPEEDGGGDQFMLGTTQAMPGAVLVGSPARR
jgi:hypothetical protein